VHGASEVGAEYLYVYTVSERAGDVN
jgi:hypothetical protein